VQTVTRRVTVSILGILGIVSLLYLMIAFDPTYGRPVAPLDDAYISFQYARQIARGQPYRYNDGDPPTTGMTSPLFGFLLAGVYALGMRGELLPAAAVALGVVWLTLTVWLTYRIAAQLLDAPASKRWAWTAALLVALTGAVQWGCFNGMETGLFTVLTLAAIATWLGERAGWSALWLGLASLIRPEGQALAALIWTLALVGPLVLPALPGGAPSGTQRRPIRWRRQALLTVAVLAGFVPMAVNRYLTGTTSAAGLLAKAWFYNVPAIPAEIARSVWFSYRDILFQRLMGLGRLGRWFVPPGLLVLALLGGVSLGLRRAWERLALLIIWLFGGALSSALLMTATWHLGRYQVPFVPIAIILTVCGLAALEARATRRWQRIVVSVLALGMVAVSLYATRHFLMLYRRSVSTTARQQLVIADWIRAYLPPDARVGVHDTGSLRYVGERPTYDLVGLTSPDGAIAWRHGAGSVFELMETSPLRPTHFAIYPDVFSIPYLAATDLFGEERFRVEVPDYAIASAGPVQGIWRADWTLAGSGDDLYQADVRAQLAGLTLVDTLDVADLADEDAHQVRWWQDALRPGFPTEVLQLTYRTDPEIEVLDGGRLLTGGIAFEIATQPHTDLWLVARLHAHEAGAVRVEVGGREIGTWAYPPVPGQWLETRFHVPAEAVDAPRTEVVLRVDPDVPGFRHYAPYYFWFWQGEPSEPATAVSTHVEAEFGEDLALVSFDLAERPWRAGEVVPIGLSWRAREATESPAKVFLHLYDAAGSLQAQSDGWAFHGTRPPYTWRPGETVRDPRALPLPADLPPGRYTLEVGLYHPEEGPRLPATVDGVRQIEDRVVLAEPVVGE
jgi:hypothetical protein